MPISNCFEVSHVRLGLPEELMNTPVTPVPPKEWFIGLKLDFAIKSGIKLLPVFPNDALNFASSTKSKFLKKDSSDNLQPKAKELKVLKRLFAPNLELPSLRTVPVIRYLFLKE